MNYLFTALFENNKTIIQDSNDKSIIYDGKNAFFDVISEENSGNKCIRFSLISKGSIFIVNLINGSFIVNDAVFFLHNPDLIKSEYKLIYNKTITKTFSDGLVNLNNDIVYNLGWEAMDADGNKVEKILKIKE